jgi:hypothetical protein
MPPIKAEREARDHPRWTIVLRLLRARFPADRGAP